MLCFVRGGAHDDQSDFDNDNDNDSRSSTTTTTQLANSSDGDDDNTDDDDTTAVDTEIVEAPWMTTAANRANPMTSKDEDEGDDMGSSYTLPSILWLSLALDVLMNRTKRVALFGSAAAVGPSKFLSLSTDTLPKSISLATGFALASAVCFALSNISTLSSSTSSSSNSKKKHMHSLSLSLVGFSVFNLAAQCVPTAPYLGLSAAVINAHNGLVGINEWNKSKGYYTADNDTNNNNIVLQMCQKALSSLRFPKSSTSSPLLSRTYTAATWMLLYTFAQTCLQLVSTTASTLDLAAPQMRALQVASLGRYVLGMSLLTTLRRAIDTDTMHRHLLFLVLNAIVSLSSMAGAMTFFLSALGGFGTTTRNVTRMMGLAAFSIVSGYQSIKGYLDLRESQ